MNRKSLNWLAAGLVVLVVLAVIGQRRDAPSSTNVDSTFLPGLAATLDAVSRVTIRAAGNELVATLERGDEGWTVSERDGFRADLTKVRHTLLSFAEAEILEAKTANPEFYAMLGVEDVDSPQAGGLSVTLEGSGEPVAVLIGDAAGEYRRYVRRASESQSYLINRDPEIGETAADWLDTTLIDLASGRVRQVTVTHPDGERVEISKSTPDQENFDVANIPADRELLYAGVANVMGGVLQNLSLEDVARAEALADDQIVTEYLTFDGLHITVTSRQVDDAAWIRLQADTTPPLGEPSEESANADAEAAELNARAQGWEFRIPAYKFDQLTRSMDELLKAET